MYNINTNFIQLHGITRAIKQYAKSTKNNIKEYQITKTITTNIPKDLP